MKVLITGATGYIGHKLALRAAQKGYTVHILVRDLMSPHLPVYPNIIPFEGDILEEKSIHVAMTGCHLVIHSAAIAQYHQKDRAVFYEVNVKGTRNMLSAALQLNVQRFIFTSSCTVIGPSCKYPMCENDPRIIAFENDYDLSKHLAEEVVRDYCKKGLHAIIVAPPWVYGPGPVVNGNVFETVIGNVLSTRICFIPSDGTIMANYAYIDDVVEGHFLAMKKGEAGEKYILGGENLSYNTFFSTLRALTKRKMRLVHIPRLLLLIWSAFDMLWYRLIGKHTKITPGTIIRLLRNRAVSSEKAIKYLGYSTTSFTEGMRQTLLYQNIK